MVAKPEISISAYEPMTDAHGQFWSPARVTLSWPGDAVLPPPAIEISVVTAIRGEMSVDELRHAHIQAAHDVLSAGLLSLEAEPRSSVQRKKDQRVG